MLTICLHFRERLKLCSTLMVLNEPMRTAATTGTASYTSLVDSCQHSRLRAALGGSPSSARPAVATPSVLVSEASRAYFWVAGMSVVSLLSILVTGTITA